MIVLLLNVALGIVYEFKYKFMATIRITKIVKNHVFLKLQMAVTEKIFDQRPKKFLWELLIPRDD